MQRSTAVQLVATTLGLLVLVAIVTGCVVWMSTGSDFRTIVVLANLAAIMIVFVEWTGVLDRKKHGPRSWDEWLGGFIVGLLMSLIFLMMDCGGHLPTFHPEFVCEGKPGISSIFTFSALCVTVIALPSALRAIIIEKFGSES